MKIRHALNLSTVAVVLAGGTSLMAQVTTGALNGHVTDSTGKPLAGARVSLESSALFQSRVLTTDAKGEFRALLLPVGNYTVKVSAANFIGKTNADVRIGVGANLTLDFALKAAKEATATVEVSADMAQTSKSDDKVAANFSAEQLEQLPTNRSFDGALILAPGITGSGTDAQVRGSGTNQINYRIDGIDVKDDSGAQQALYQPLEDSIEDVQVVLSALNARNGRSQGGQVNVVTKSGGNDFEGTIRSFQGRNSWTSDQAYSSNDLNNTRAGVALSHKTDITISGPIWKDRVWFYFGTRFQPSNSTNAHAIGTDGTLNGKHITDANQTVITSPLNTYGKYLSVDQELANPTPQSASAPNGLPSGYSLNFLDLNKPVTADTDFKKYEGKLTAMITDNNILTFTLLHEKSTFGGTSSEGLPPAYTLELSQVGPSTDKVDAYTIGLNSNLASNWTLEARYYKATHTSGQYFHSDPGYDGGSVYTYFSTGVDAINNMFYNPEFARNQAYWGPFAVATNASAPDPKKEGNQGFTANIKTFQELGGQHEIDFGGEQFETINNVGRGRNGNLGIWTGGYYYNAGAEAGKQFLFPAYWNNSGNLYSDDVHSAPAFTTISWDDWTLRTPAPTVEKFWVHSSDTKNKANAFWINDIYTINSQWNVMVGLRSNSFSQTDNGGKTLMSLSLVEPRFQVKWNPDGRGKNVFTLSYAKLASAFSDQIAANYRGNEWEVRTVHHWTGGNLANNSKSLDDAAATASDPTHGVRWVTYAQLNDMKNYGSAIQYVDSRQFYKAGGLKVPYANEITLGMDHAFDTGWVRVNLVQRTYKDTVLQRIRKWGIDGMVLMTDPSAGQTSGEPGPSIYEQAEYWTNSGLDQIYRGVELSWQKSISDRLTFGGSFNQFQQTGYDDVDYYNYSALRATLPGGGPAVEGIISKGIVARAHLTYVVPVGKGNVSASIMGAYWTSGVSSITAVNNYNNSLTQNLWYTSTGENSGTYGGYQVIPFNDRGANMPRQYRTYYGGMGAYKTGYDQYDVTMKLQAKIPLGLGKTMLLTSVEVTNLFNHFLPTGGWYDWSQDFSKSTVGQQGVSVGRPLAGFGNPWGPISSPGNPSYNAPRSLTNFSIGLKF